MADQPKQTSQQQTPNQQKQPPQQGLANQQKPAAQQTEKAVPQPQQQKPAQPSQQQKPAQQGGRPPMPGAKPPAKEENPDFRGIVRIVGKDLDGHFTLYKALIRVRGISHTLARVMEKVLMKELKLTKKTRIGDLSEEQIDRADEILRNPAAHGVKAFLLNRQKDRDTGKNLHLLMSDLGFAVKQDIQFEKDIHTYRGWRHNLGQRVRGQHSRTTGRTGLTMGVLKKAMKEQKASAAAAQEKGKPAEKKK